MDGVTFDQIEAAGLTEWLSGLREELRQKTYRSQSVRRVLIPKPGGGERPLGIPAVRDRVVQTAVKLVIEPIFEADLEPKTHGYRPDRSAADAIKQVHSLLWQGHTDVVDADLSKYFDTIPHSELMSCVARRIVDRMIPSLLKMWLKAPVEERDRDGTRRMTGGKNSRHGMELVILGPDGSKQRTVAVGEVCLRGDMVMRGYWNRPEETAKALADGWLHTGDAGWLDDDGLLFIVDRLKDMIVSGGENVYSAEVETALMSHPAVLECAVFGIPDVQWGEAVHAVIRLRDGEQTDAETLRAHCATQIARYKCPRSITLDTTPLPRSAIGKVLKTELRRSYWAGQTRNVH